MSKFSIEEFRLRDPQCEKCPTCGSAPGFHCVEFTGQDFFAAGRPHPVQPHFVRREPPVPAT